MKAGTMRWQSTVRRMFASMTLAALALSFVAPSIEAAAAPLRDCPLAPEGERHAMVVHAMPDSACEHTGPGPCLGTLGCLAAPPAIAMPAANFVVPTTLIVLAVRPATHFGDLFRTGPPTPPPNHI